MLQTIQFKSFDKKHQYIKFFVELKENTYVFIIRWNNYGSYGNISILDYNDTPIINGKALVNNLKIRNNKLPYDFYFIQVNGESYEPTIYNLAEEFAFVYDDGV